MKEETDKAIEEAHRNQNNQANGKQHQQARRSKSSSLGNANAQKVQQNPRRH